MVAMPNSQHRNSRGRTAQRVIRQIASVSVTAVRRVRAKRRAYAAMPKPVPWDWARPRLLPLLAGPFFDQPGAALVRSVLSPGIAVAFGINLGRGVLPYVDAPVAERWECTPRQICDAAVSNLERAAASIPSESVTNGTLSGHIVHLLERPVGWAASVLLVPNELKRLFGDHDQIFIAAGHGTLISLPIDAPSHVARELVFEYEARELYPLMPDPFALIGGQLSWGGSTEYDDDIGDSEFAVL
jgi:hypothetical protein